MWKIERGCPSVRRDNPRPIDLARYGQIPCKRFGYLVNVLQPVAHLPGTQIVCLQVIFFFFDVDITFFFTKRT